MKVAKLPWHGLLILLRRYVVSVMIFAIALLWVACAITFLMLIILSAISILADKPFHYPHSPLYQWVAFAGFISPFVWIFARNSLNEARTLEKEMRKTARKADAENYNGD